MQPVPWGGHTRNLQAVCLLPYSDRCPCVPGEVGRAQTFGGVLWVCPVALVGPFLPIWALSHVPRSWDCLTKQVLDVILKGAQLSHLGWVSPQSSRR